MNIEKTLMKPFASRTVSSSSRSASLAVLSLLGSQRSEVLNEALRSLQEISISPVPTEKLKRTKRSSVSGLLTMDFSDLI